MYEMQDVSCDIFPHRLFLSVVLFAFLVTMRSEWGTLLQKCKNSNTAVGSLQQFDKRMIQSVSKSYNMAMSDSTHFIVCINVKRSINESSCTKLNYLFQIPDTKTIVNLIESCCGVHKNNA